MFQDLEAQWSKPREIVVKIPLPETLPHGVYVCPTCGGSGVNHATGSVSMSQTEIRITPSAPCTLCRGARKVRIEPFEGKP